MPPLLFVVVFFFKPSITTSPMQNASITHTRIKTIVLTLSPKIHQDKSSRGTIITMLSGDIIEMGSSLKALVTKNNPATISTPLAKLIAPIVKDSPAQMSVTKLIEKPKATLFMASPKKAIDSKVSSELRLFFLKSRLLSVELAM